MVKRLSGGLTRSTLVAIVVIGVLLSVSIWQAAARKQKNGVVFQNGKFDLSQAGTPEARAHQREQFIASVREGMSAMRFPSAGSSSEEVRNATASLAEHIRVRTGITVTESTQARLSLLEEKASQAGIGGISVDRLSRILTNWIVDRASGLTDNELPSAENSLRGFITSELAANPPPKLAELGQRKNLHLRASVLAHESSAVPLLRSIRDRAAAGDETLRQQAYVFVRDEVRKRIAVLSEAVPGLLGASADIAEVRLTPLRSFLIAYAVVSDDPLTHNQANVEKAMRTRREWAVNHGGGGYFPPPEGHYAYGSNGYLYSSPLDLFFNEPSLDRLLTALGRRRNL